MDDIMDKCAYRYIPPHTHTQAAVLPPYTEHKAYLWCMCLLLCKHTVNKVCRTELCVCGPIKPVSAVSSHGEELRVWPVSLSISLSLWTQRRQVRRWEDWDSFRGFNCSLFGVCSSAGQYHRFKGMIPCCACRVCVILTDVSVALLWLTEWQQHLTHNKRNVNTFSPHTNTLRSFSAADRLTDKGKTGSSRPNDGCCLLTSRKSSCVFSRVTVLKKLL